MNMNIRQNVFSALKAAMIKKDAKVISTLRLIMAAIKDKDIVLKGNGDASGIDETAIILLMQTMIKQRNASIVLFKQGIREDLVKIEEDEILIISSFLPKQLNDQEIEDAVVNAIKLTQSVSIKDMGKVINLMKQNYIGKMDFRIVSAVVKEKLTK
jgi:uncharacterized protein YqeY